MNPQCILGGLGQEKFDILALKESNQGNLRYLVWFAESLSKVLCGVLSVTLAF